VICESYYIVSASNVLYNCKLFYLEWVILNFTVKMFQQKKSDVRNLKSFKFILCLSLSLTFKLLRQVT